MCEHPQLWNPAGAGGLSRVRLRFLGQQRPGRHGGVTQLCPWGSSPPGGDDPGKGPQEALGASASEAKRAGAAPAACLTRSSFLGHGHWP